MSRKPLSTEAVIKVARLCRLHISEENICKCRDELTTILDYFQQIEKLDIIGVEPLHHPTEMFSPLAEDTVGESLSTAQVLQNAPASEGKFIAVPGVFNKGMLPVKPEEYADNDSNNNKA